LALSRQPVHPARLAFFFAVLSHEKTFEKNESKFIILPNFTVKIILLTIMLLYPIY
jgi:hypothetical protein